MRFQSYRLGCNNSMERDAFGVAEANYLREPEDSLMDKHSDRWVDVERELFIERVEDTFGYFGESFMYGDAQKISELQRLLLAEAGTQESESDRLHRIGNLVNQLVNDRCQPSDDEVAEEV